MPDCSMGNRFSVAIVHGLSPNILAWSGGTGRSGEIGDGEIGGDRGDRGQEAVN